jgi:Protein of unknown function (DUF1670)
VPAGASALDGDRVFSTIVEETDVALEPIEQSDRQVRFAYGRSSNRQRVDRIGLSERACRVPGIRHHLRGHSPRADRGSTDLNRDGGDLPRQRGPGARRSRHGTRHSESAIKRYLSDFRQVAALFAGGASIPEIRAATGRSAAVISEYVAIYERARREFPAVPRLHDLLAVATTKKGGRR